MSHIAFGLDQPEEIKAYFNENGYVAIRGVLSKDECERTLHEMGSQMKKLSSEFDINDVQSYDKAPIRNSFGIYTRVPIYSQQFLLNRQNPNVYKAFSLLYNEDKIIVNHDRAAFYRPTIGLNIDGAVVDKPEWKTGYTFPGLHLDFHPGSYKDSDDLIKKREELTYENPEDFVTENNLYVESDGLQLQGVINLIDNREEDGGFQCVPKFPSSFDEWLSEKEFGDKIVGLFNFNNRDKVDMKYIHSPIRVPVPQGSIIIWNQKMAHGTRPNSSDRPRAIQFIKMFPKRTFSEKRLKCRSKALRKLFAQNKFTSISKIGKIVFDI